MNQPPGLKKPRHYIPYGNETYETKWGIRICYHGRILTLCSHTGKVRESVFKIYAQCSNICSKYFKIPLVSKPQYSNQQGSHYTLSQGSLFQYSYLEKQEQNMTKVFIDEKEKKVPPLIFDSSPFRLPYLFSNF